MPLELNNSEVEINYNNILTIIKQICPFNNYTILCAWGNDIMSKTEAQTAIELLKNAIKDVPTQKIKCLGLTKQGHPRSPLARMEKEDFKLFDLKNYRV